MDDKDWCVQYLDDKKKCSDIAKDKIASYCNMCGYCLGQWLYYGGIYIIFRELFLVAYCRAHIP